MLNFKETKMKINLHTVPGGLSECIFKQRANKRSVSDDLFCAKDKL